MSLQYIAAMRNIDVPSYTRLPLSREDRRDLRSDHAGEHGAVAIYRGILSVTQDADLQCFARRHLLAEMRHLRYFERFLPQGGKSRLLGVWWCAGWLLGAGSAVMGARATYATIAAVERFVEGHYLEQIESMEARAGLEELVVILRKFCADEVHHRKDAEVRTAPRRGRIRDGWSRLVASGSRVGVAIARRI